MFGFISKKKIIKVAVDTYLGKKQFFGLGIGLSDFSNYTFASEMR